MTHRLLKHVQDVVRGSAPLGKLRSPHWATVEKEFRKTHPGCCVCATTKKIEVHHKKPFHLHPEDELKPANLISLCRIHHQWWGHLGNWKSFNPEVEADSIEWAKKIAGRPKGGEAA